MTPVDLAISRNDIPRLDLRLRFLGNLHEPFEDSPLTKAILPESLEIVEHLLKNANLKSESQDSEGTTPLHYGVLTKRIHILRALLKKNGTNINYQNSRRDSALHGAVRSQNPQLIREIISVTNIDLNLKNAFENTTVSIVGFYKNSEILIQILTARADPRYFNDKLLRNSGCEFTSFNSQILLSAGVDPRTVIADPDFKYALQKSLSAFRDFGTVFRKTKRIETRNSALLQGAKLFLKARLKIGPYHNESSFQLAYSHVVAFLIEDEDNSQTFLKDLNSDSNFQKILYYRTGLVLSRKWNLPFPIQFHQETESDPIDLILQVKGI